MITVGAFEAKTHLSALLDRVAHGEEVTITKHGKPIARLVAAVTVDQAEVDEAVERTEKVAQGHDIGWAVLERAER